MFNLAKAIYRRVMQNPASHTFSACLPRSESFLIIFMGALHSPHRRCAFRIVSTTLVYSQCHVVPLVSPAGTPRTRGNWAREPCYVVWRVGFNFDGSHAVASSTPAGIPASLPRLCGHPTSVSATGRRRCPVRCPKEIEDQEHEQVLPASGSSANANRREHLRMDLAADPH
jgi:hypothetical protein